MREIVLAHSELTNTIYALIGKEKIDITEQAIAEVKAIKALEQEPCEDAISRQEVLELDFDMSEIDGEHFEKPFMVVEVEDIQKLPSVKPQEKTGQWIERRNRATGHLESVCSECGAEEGHPYNDYCGNCGAKMEG